MPAPWLPLVYFAVAHLALLLACGVLIVQPALPGAFHYHPRMIALTHLVTLGWISGSILGALYIVGPLALGLPLPRRSGDVVAAVAFWTGTTGMVAGFWDGRYDIVGVAAVLVIGAVTWVGTRVLLGLRTARVPQAVALHIALAFGNVVLAALLGLWSAVGRSRGWFEISPLALAMAHAHLAGIGWAVMMIIGVAYRLVPMFLPAAMPAGRDLAWSAILLELGALGSAWSLATGSRTLLIWALCVLAAFWAFSTQMRRTVANKRPRPVGMTGHDWSTWQTHVALLWGATAAVLGVWVATRSGPTAWTWVYAVAALVGFIAQMVVGIAGRLLPIHAWYVAMRRGGGAPPPRAVHALIEPAYALAIMSLWLLAVPLLAIGLGQRLALVVGVAASLLAVAVVVQIVYGVRMVARAGTPVAVPPS